MPTGTTVTLRPDGTFGAGGWTFLGGAVTVHGATSDNSDSTSASGPNGSVNAYVSLTAVSIPINARIVQVTIKVRWQGDNSGLGAVATVDNLTGKWKYQTSYYKVPSTTQTLTFAAQTVRPDGSPWTVAAINSLTVLLAGYPAVKFMEVYGDVLYNEAPVVSAVTPTGNVTTQQPAIGWTYTDPESDRQERWLVRVFTAAQAATAGFDPETAPAVADSGLAYVSASSVTTWTASAPLAPGAYVAYVKAADAGSGGRFSAWASSAFVVVGDPPAPPVLISATPDPANGRVAVVARQADNMLNRQTASGDGVAGENLRWFSLANTNTPSIGGTGVNGNGIQATVTATAAASVRTDRNMIVAANLAHAWGAWIKASAGGGVVHLDVDWYNAADVFVSTSAGSNLTLTTALQSVGNTATAPGTADHAQLVWRSSSLAGGLVLTWDQIEFRPGVTVTGGYRGGLDSRNLLGVDDGSFNSTGVGNWIVVGNGSIVSVSDTAGYEAFTLQYTPATVGASHVLKCNIHIPLPLALGTYQFSFQGRANAANLVAGASMLWHDANDQIIGAPISALAVTLPNGAALSAQIGGNAVAPADATSVHVELALTGEASTANRWIFDRFQFMRLPDGVSAVQAFRPTSQVDVYPQVEYSLDGGVSWGRVRSSRRAGYDPITRLTTVYDYEATLGAAVQYRAKTAAEDYQIDPANGAALQSAPSSVLLATLTSTGYYVVDPYTSTRVQFEVAASGGAPELGMTRPSPQQDFSPLGRSFKMIISDIQKGNEFDWRIVFPTGAAFDAFEAILATGHVLLVQTPLNRQWYILPGSARKATATLEGNKDHGFVVEFSGYEQGRPDVG